MSIKNKNVSPGLYKVVAEEKDERIKNDTLEFMNNNNNNGNMASNLDITADNVFLCVISDPYFMNDENGNAEKLIELTTVTFPVSDRTAFSFLASFHPFRN